MTINSRLLTTTLSTMLLWMLLVADVCAAKEEEGTLRAGAAVADITPEKGVSMKGSVGGNGIVKEVHDPLHARCVAMSNGETTLAICVVDATSFWAEGMEKAKAMVHKRIGLPVERILISATHSHAAIRVRGISTEPIDLKYYALVEEGVADAICQAVRNLAPAEVAYGVVSKPEYVKGRRWRIEAGSCGPNPFGERTDRAWMYPRVKNRLDPEPLGRSDPSLSILSLRHVDGTPLAVLGNYSIHYVGGFKRNCVSADYFASFAEELGKVLDAENSTGDHPSFVGIMSNGNSGNIAPGQGVRGYDGMRRIGRDLAEAAADICHKGPYLRDVPLAMVEERLELQVRKPDAQRIKWARDVLAGKWKIKPMHGWTRTYAQGTLQLAEYPDTVSPRFQVIRIGDLAIASNPCEMYAETGLAIKEASPFKLTFNIELANGQNGYLPPPEQHELGGYTTWPTISSYLEVNASEKIKAHLLKLLARVAH
jgi:neutral ceramidase